MWEFVGSVEYGHLSLLFKWSCVIAQLVQKNTQSPYIALLVNWLPPIDINHLRAAILHGCVPLYIIFNQTSLGCIGGSRPGWRGGTKVAELVYLGGAGECNKNVFDLEIAMEKRRLEIVHAGDTFGDVAKDLENFGLGEAVL